MKEIARQVAQQLSSEKSVQAVLYGDAQYYPEKNEKPVDQFDLIIIKDERDQRGFARYERRVQQVLIDYHFMKLRNFMRSGSKWVKNMKIVYAQTEAMRKKIQRKLNNIPT